MIVLKLPLMRSLIIFLGSLILTSLVIGNAFYHKKQFFPSIVYIMKSSASLAVIYIQVFVFAIAFVKFIKSLFFGQLRPAEIEHIMEKGWFAITETCLAFTLFRDDFTPKFVALFGFLLVMKCFHWLGEERVDYMERSPIITLLFTTRIIALIMTLVTIDTFFIKVAYVTTLTKGATVQLVFGFEYAILLLLVFNMYVKFALHRMDVRAAATPWENKTTYLLYLELVTGLFRVSLYSAFIGIMVRIHTFPLFAIRPMYMAVKSLKRSFKDIIMSRRAITNMNNLYPHPDPNNDFPITPAAPAKTIEPSSSVDEATTSASIANLPGDLNQQQQQHSATSHLLCIICREEMRRETYMTCKKLPCNHIFHTICLRGWFQRQQTCPTCRLNVLKVDLSRPAAGSSAAAAAGAASQPPTITANNNNQMGSAGFSVQNNNLSPGGGVPPPWFPNYGGYFMPPPPFLVNPQFFANSNGGNSNTMISLNPDNAKNGEENNNNLLNLHYYNHHNPVGFYPYGNNPYYYYNQHLPNPYRHTEKDLTSTISTTTTTTLDPQSITNASTPSTTAPLLFPPPLPPQFYMPNMFPYPPPPTKPPTTFSSQDSRAQDTCDRQIYQPTASKDTSLTTSFNSPNDLGGSSTSNPDNKTSSTSFGTQGIVDSVQFGSLTDSGIRAMEGDYRNNIIKRIECLKNIQVLMDSAVIQMYQYISLFNSLNPVQSHATLLNGQSSTHIPPPVPTNSTNLAKTKDFENVEDLRSIPDSDNMLNDNNITPTSTSSLKGNTDPEIRRRRIEKMTKQSTS